MEFDAQKTELFKKDVVSLDDDDDTLSEKLGNLENEGKSLYELKLNYWKENSDYFNGTKKYEHDGKLYDRITNPIWPLIRSMVGLETDQLPKPVVKPPLYLAYDPATGAVDTEKRDKLLKIGRDLETWLSTIIQKQQFQSTLTKLYFQKHKFDDGFLMPYWDFEANNFAFEFTRTPNIIIDQNADNIRDAEWIIVKMPRNRKYMIQMFGEELAGQLTYSAQNYGQNNAALTNESKTACELRMWLFDTFIIYVADDKILKKIANPYYSFDSEGEQYRQHISGKDSWIKQLEMFEFAKDQKTGKYDDNKVNGYYKRLKETNQTDTEFKVLKNYFKYPRKPLIHFKGYDDGEGLYSYPGFKQLIKLADDIESKKQRFARYEEHASEPTVLYNSSEITEEDAKKALKRRVGQAIGIPVTDGNLKENLIFDSGQEMPISVINNMRDSENKLDEMIGSHDISRGQTDPTNKTAEGIRLVQMADQTPIRILTRADEDAMQEVFEWIFQFVALFYNKNDHYMEGKDDNIGEYQKPITNEMIIDGLEVYTKTGSTLPVDRDRQREIARNDAKAGIIAPETYFEQNESYGEPKIQAIRLANWLNSKLVSDADPNQTQGRFADDPNVQQAIGQNKEMMLGRNIDIINGEDSRIHWDIHLQGLKEVEAMPTGQEKETAKAAFTEHLQETQDKLASEGIDIETLPSGQPTQQ